MPDVSFPKPRLGDFRNPLKKRNLQMFLEVSNWVQGLDLNQRPARCEFYKSELSDVLFGVQLACLVAMVLGVQAIRPQTFAKLLVL